MKKENTKKNNKGFSLVELIVVIAIMAVLMVVLAPALLRYVEKARVQTDETTASEVLNAVETALSDDEIYQKVTGSSTGDISVLYDGPSGVVTSDNADLQTELYNTLKANNSGMVKKAASKIHAKTQATDEYLITASYDASKMCYVVSGYWK